MSENQSVEISFKNKRLLGSKGSSKLTPAESKILEALAGGDVYSGKSLASIARRKACYDPALDDNLVKVYVCRLRKKLVDAAGLPGIVNTRLLGYKLDARIRVGVMP